MCSSCSSDANGPPLDLLTRGRHLWADLTEHHDYDAAARLILHEACRAADRLEMLDAIIRAGEGDTAKTMAEARQQQMALKSLLAELRERAGTPVRRGQGGQARTSGAGATRTGGRGGLSVVANLAARVADRSAGAAG